MLDILVLGLATWRVSYFFIEDTGPFRVAERIRHLVGADRPGEITGLAFIFTCIYCMSVWVAGILWFVFIHDWNHGLLTIAAASAIAVLVDRLQRT